MPPTSARRYASGSRRRWPSTISSSSPAAWSASCAGTEPLYVGGDLIDIPAIAATGELGGRGLAVGPRIAEHADGTLASPDAVLEQLRALVAGEAEAFII
ncbi:MAG: hypothetical protein ACKO01_06690 [Erythrobacter sp.]